MRNTRDTTDTPGFVLMTSNAGRIVWAVVCAAPETMPSARPRCTIIVPKYDTSVTVSAACAIVTPLWARSRAYSSANCCTCTASNGREHLGSADVDAELDGAGAHLDLLAEDREVGDAAREHGGRGAEDPVVVALGQHDAAARRRARAR